MSVKFPHIHLYPKTQDELNDPEFMRNLVVRKMAGIRDNGNEASTSQDRKDLLIALSREHDKTKWVEIIATFCVIHMVWEGKVDEKGKIKVVSTATRAATKVRVDNLVRARAARAVIRAEAKKGGVDKAEGVSDAD